MVSISTLHAMKKTRIKKESSEQLSPKQITRLLRLLRLVRVFSVRICSLCLTYALSEIVENNGKTKTSK